MKAAILISVSEYKKLDNLPACVKDATLVKELLIASGEFEEEHVYCFINPKDTLSLKTDLARVIRKLRAAEVDQILFYYTGHGNFWEDEFYYIGPDFEVIRRRETSLENSELDQMLKSLNPNLAIKLVDACHSGMTYVKDSQSVKAYLEDSGGHFKNCYFMFSSRLDQSSYQDQDLSWFTRSFLSAVEKRESGEIRYKDIIDSISDDFSERPDQSPFFVAQAHFTEVFCTITDSIRSVKELHEQSDPQESPAVPEESDLDLIESIKSTAKVYLSEEEVHQTLGALKEQIESYEYLNPLPDLYDFKMSFERFYGSASDIPRADVIGRWLKDNSHDFFARYEEEEYEVPVSIYLPYWERRVVNPRYRTRISGFETTSKAPYDYIRIAAEPRYPNIPFGTCIIVLLLSKTSIQIFSTFTNLIEKNWREREIPEKVKWETIQVSLKDKPLVLNTVHDIQKAFAQWRLDTVKNLFA